MEQPFLTRRRLIAGLALGAAPALVMPSMVQAEVATDAELLHAWNMRQHMLALIERRGSFFHAETYSPAEAEQFDRAEMIIYAVPATTASGALVKMWVALSHMGGQIRDEDDRAEHDGIRRADLADVRSFIRDRDFDMVVAFSAIEALTSLVEG